MLGFVTKNRLVGRSGSDLEMKKGNEEESQSDMLWHVMPSLYQFQWISVAIKSVTMVLQKFCRENPNISKLM